MKFISNLGRILLNTKSAAKNLLSYARPRLSVSYILGVLLVTGGIVLACYTSTPSIHKTTDLKHSAASSTKVPSKETDATANVRPQDDTRSVNAATTSQTQTKASTTTSPPSKTSTSTQNKLGISLSTTSLTFAVGSRSSLVTVRTTDSSSVVWTVNSSPASGLVPRGSSSPSAQYSFYMDSVFPTTKPGVYTISVAAFNPNQTSQHASQTITVDLLPQFSFDIVPDLSHMTSGQGRYIPFHIVTLSGTPATIQPGAVTIDPPGQYPAYYYTASSSMTALDQGYILVNTDGTGVTYIKHVTVTFTAYSGMYQKTISFPLDLP